MSDITLLKENIITFDSFFSDIRGKIDKVIDQNPKVAVITTIALGILGIILVGSAFSMGGAPFYGTVLLGATLFCSSLLLTREIGLQNKDLFDVIHNFFKFYKRKEKLAIPKIIFNDHFEKNIAKVDPKNANFSKIYSTGNKPLKNGDICFINGVRNSFNGAEKSAKYISDLVNGLQITGVYNATHGMKHDLEECRIGLQEYVATTPVRKLHKVWDDFFKRSNKNSQFLVIAHSQGAIHVRNALLSYNKKHLKRINVVFVAPAAYLPKILFKHLAFYKSYISKKDYVPRLDRMAKDEQGENLVALNKLGKAHFDHRFRNLTYRASLKNELNRFIQKCENLQETEKIDEKKPTSTTRESFLSRFYQYLFPYESSIAEVVSL